LGNVNPVGGVNELIFRLCVFASLLILSTLPAVAQESNIIETVDSIALKTDDGLTLTFDRSSGVLRSLDIDGKTQKLKDVPVVRFEEVLPLLKARNLFEKWDKTQWLFANKKDAEKSRWLKVAGQDKMKPARELLLNQTQAVPLALSAKCKYKVVGDAEGWLSRHLAVNAVCEYLDGSVLPEQSVYFGQYDHESQINSTVICPDKPIYKIKIELTANDPKSTAWFSDLSLKSAAYRISSPKDKCQRIDARVIQDFNIKDSNITGQVSYQAARDYIQVRCLFHSTNKSERAVSAYLAIPFDAIGGTWYDDARRSQKIEPNRIYRNAVWYGAGRDGYFSRYPIGVIKTADGVGLAIGTALDEPRVNQIEYDSTKKELQIRYDLGLTPDSGKWADRGSFASYIFTYNTSDGFRGAAEKFQSINKWAFEKRVKNEGLWIAFLTPKSIPGGYEDFHFQFIESMCNVGWEQQQGMTSLKYAEPWIHHHEFQPSALPSEVTGPIDPLAPVRTAQRLKNETGSEYPPEYRNKYAAYLGSYITDKWGNPQGYFFRGGRNENMMIVNPNPDLPALDGADYSSGAYDMEVYKEASLLWKQWSINGWNLYRVDERPCLEIDPLVKQSGRQSVRFDPVRSKGFWSHYVHGISQSVYSSKPGPYEFSFWARGMDVPAGGTQMKWNVEFQTEEDKLESFAVELKGLSGEWKHYSIKLEPKLIPAAVSIVLVNNPWIPDPAVLWIDNLSLSSQTDGVNLLVNPDFEEAELLSGEAGGAYLDTMECYANNLNYRRQHWLYSEEPPTFDTARQVALQQQFSHITYAKQMSEYLHSRGKILFANCVPETVYAAPYIDALGMEDNWLPGGTYTPRSDERFCFDRFMAGSKPFCLLNYADFSLEQLEKYVKRCMFYGVFPGIISSSSTSGKWYWSNAVRVKRDRVVFAKYMPLILEIAKAGWQPVTLAESENSNIWLERFGNGTKFYLTVCNSTSQLQNTRVLLDKRLYNSGKLRVIDAETGKEIESSNTGFDIDILPEDTLVVRIERSE